MDEEKINKILDQSYFAELVEINEMDFKEVFGRLPKNKTEWDNFVHYVQNGVEAQLDWGIIYSCTKDLANDILEEEEVE